MLFRKRVVPGNPLQVGAVDTPHTVPTLFSTEGVTRGQVGRSRQANTALYRIVLTRISSDPTTKQYVQQRQTEGLSNREIMRCLKRYFANGNLRTPPNGGLKTWVGCLTR